MRSPLAQRSSRIAGLAVLASIAALAITFLVGEYESPIPLPETSLRGLVSEAATSRATTREPVNPLQELPSRLAEPADDRVTYSGHVFDPDGLPLAGATVGVHGALVSESAFGTPALASVVTDAMGRFHIVAKPFLGRPSLIATKAPWLPAEIVAPRPEREHGLRLRAVRSIEGRVVDAISGSAIQDATVRTHFSDVAVRTGADGRFMHPSVAVASSDHLLVQHLAYANSIIRIDPENDEVRAVRVELHRGIEIRGTVVDRDSLAPIPGATVAAWGAALPFATTDSTGRFDLRVRPREHFELCVTSPRHIGVAWFDGGAVPDEDREVTIALVHPAWIDAYVTDERGQPIVGAFVAVRVDGGTLANPHFDYDRVRFPTFGHINYLPPSGSSTTDRNGRALATVMPSLAILHVEAAHADYGSITPSELALAHAGERASRVFVLKPTGTIVGTLRRNDRPFSADVAWRHEQGTAGKVATDGEGLFRITGLSGGRVHVSAYSRGDRRILASSDVLVAPGEPASLDLRFDAAVATITGRVTTPEGTPLAGATVRAARAEIRTRIDDAIFVTGESGRFSLEVLAGHDYLVTVAHDRRERESRFLPAGFDGIEIVLQPKSGLTIELRDAVTGEALTSARGDVWWQRSNGGKPNMRSFDNSALDTRIELELPHDTYDLTVDVRDLGYVLRTLRGIQVGGGVESNVVVIDLSRGIEVEFRVIVSARTAKIDPNLFDLWIEASEPNEIGTRAEASTGLGALRRRPLLFDSRHRASVRGLEPGTYALGLHSKRLRVDPGHVDLRELPTSPIELRVVAR
jgi:hypothetical protein